MVDTIQILLLSFLPCFSQKRTFEYLVDFFWGIVSIKRKTVTGIYLCPCIVYAPLLHCP